jgi:hypothetical protein
MEEVGGRERERERGVYRVSVGKPEGKSPFGRPRSRWEDKNLIHMKWDVGLWTGSIWLRKKRRVVGTCECGNELSGSIKCGEFLDYLRTG